MGLDMYLTGRKFFSTWAKPNRMEDGYPIERLDVALGYWRKHPNLHGYIVKEHGPKNEEGEPIDDCTDIELDADELVAIITAIQEDQLPDTQGFFFGTSPNKESMDKEEKEAFEAQKKEDLDIFGRALGWLTIDHDASTPTKPFNKYCIYRASW